MWHSQNTRRTHQVSSKILPPAFLNQQTLQFQNGSLRDHFSCALLHAVSRPYLMHTANQRHDRRLPRVMPGCILQRRTPNWRSGISRHDACCGYKCHLERDVPIRKRCCRSTTIDGIRRARLRWFHQPGSGLRRRTRTCGDTPPRFRNEESAAWLRVRLRLSGCRGVKGPSPRGTRKPGRVFHSSTRIISGPVVPSCVDLQGVDSVHHCADGGLCCYHATGDLHFCMARSRRSSRDIHRP